jgi:hypothetical protein
MLPARSFCCCALALGLILLIEPSARADYACDALSLQIATVANNPFSADEVISSWQIAPDGSKKQTGPSLVAHVARDDPGTGSLPYFSHANRRFSKSNAITRNRGPLIPKTPSKSSPCSFRSSMMNAICGSISCSPMCAVGILIFLRCNLPPASSTFSAPSCSTPLSSGTLL